MSSPNFALLSKQIESAPTKTRPPGSGPDFEELIKEIEKEPRSVGGFISNVGTSGINFADSIYQLLRHPIDTAKGVGKLAVGLGEKAISPILTDPDNPTETEGTQMVDALFKHMSDRFGGIENLKKTAYEDPIGLAADFSGLISGGGSLISRSASLSKVGSVVSKVGTYSDPIQLAVRGTGQVLRGAGRVTGETVGLGTAARQAFAKHSADFTNALRGKTKEKDILETAKNAYSAVAKQRKIDYESGLGTLAGEVDKVPSQRALADSFGKHKISIRVSMPATDEASIVGGIKIKTVKLTDPEDIFNFIVEKKLPGGMELPAKASIRPYFKDSSIRHSGSDMSRVNDVFNDMLDWKSMDAKDADRLRQGIHDRIPRREVEGAVPVENAAADITKTVHNVLEDSIMSDVPGYSDLVRRYRESTKFLSEVKDDLLGRSDGVTFKRLQNAAKEDSAYQQMLEEAFTTRAGSKLRDQLGGYAMKQIKPKFAHFGYASMPIMYAIIHGINPVVLASLALTSPRILGEVGSLVGKTSRAVKPVVSKVTAGKYRPLTYVPPPPEEPK